MDINARRRAAEGSGANNDGANPNLSLNPGDLAVAITPAKGARRRREEELSCTEAIP
jgi:hypothetical protein